MATTSLTTPDRWSLESWFSGFGKADYIDFKAALVADIDALKKRASALGSDANEIVGVINTLEAVGDRLGHLSAYLGCLSADDANDEAVKADEAWISTLEAENTKLLASLRSALAALSDAAFDSMLAESSLKDAEHTVKRLRHEGQHQMSAEMESLAADLNVNGLHAWGRLYDTLTGKMEFEMTFPDGHKEIVPMSRRRALMSEPDRKVREAAFHDGQKPWNEHATTLAAALNGIAGTRLSLYGRRGLPHFLDTPLFDGAMSRNSLDAMLEAIHANIELPRRAIRKAAKLQGTAALHYFDLEAPQIAAPDEKELTWDEACKTVDHAFSAAYPKLGAYFREMLAQRWIEAQPRAGKRPGAFCTGSQLKHEERVYMTFHKTVHDMVTLAHEVGHAWHSCVLRPARSFAAGYPMTLAETASNFGEMILLDGLMSDPGITEATKAYLLDQEMLRAHAYLINIPMRYEFEKAFYTERAGGELSVSRFSELMSEAQRKLYGDTLLPDGTDPMFWAYKMHFFITGVSFYNFPYVFGYLLSQALFARFKAEGAAFLPRYEAFLAMTGSATCEEVVKKTLGEDLTKPDFWATALKAIEPSLVAYERVGL
ncbi:MAG: M3 family oligoendopeptidase [Prosthecobacter sp.]|jgi:oligoendopeptidase F|uniref:M3 family oligoendopeptidase n=1 Tax=Prosthecobacter sp. TaxID=1965333 RepID=UPI0019E1C0F9|nr:M3 family oligoendopeptidase [Prosthecobacter sp.]MBE2284939.1 M3 family oligoendopeptidase [Prosthecobacter sp.]